MANIVIKKTLLIKGDKGDIGNTAQEQDTTVPVNGLIFYEGDEIPEGYELYQELEEGS